ncbi:hypothetical protein SESBI_22025 [Sesbania bispinosa]|nr:hypothetical protein SESBI_22025 [Sesbania bispinosa]
MGNTPPYVVQLGNFASINILEGEANGEHYEKRSVSYRADERSAEVSIKRIKPPNSKSNGSSKFIISITDTDKMNILPVRLWPYRFEMMVERVEGQHLKVTYAKTRVVHDKDVAWGVVALAKVGVTLPRLNVYEEDATKNRKMTTSADGGITETSLNPYRVKGRDKQRGLVVIEWKKKAWNENPYMVIVSHYLQA